MFVHVGSESVSTCDLMLLSGRGLHRDVLSEEDPVKCVNECVMQGAQCDVLDGEETYDTCI